MKLVILGDTHVGSRGDSLDFHKYFKRFYEDVFFPYLDENGIKNIIQLGDLFDRRKFINFNSLYLSRKYFFDELKKRDIKLYTVIGNHDVAFKNTNEVNSPSLLLKEYDNIIITEQPTTECFDGLDVDLFPWICSENEESVTNFIKNTKSEICMGHFEISGFEMDKGNLCTEGLDKKMFSRYDIVLSGHFHHKSTNDNITYVGTPYELTWADYNDSKGFHIFDTTTRDMEFIKNPYTMFNKLYFDDSNTDFEYWKSYDFTPLNETYVKVVVLNKHNPYLFDFIIDNLYKNGVSDISIVEDLSDTINVDDDIVDQAEDTLTIINKVIDGLENIDNSKLKSIIKELYIEALTVEQNQ